MNRPAAPTVPTQAGTPAPGAGPAPGPGHEPEPVDWAAESTVGEEDPGASLDLALDPPPAPAPGSGLPPAQP